jgi:hypothetical protein
MTRERIDELMDCAERGVPIEGYVVIDLLEEIIALQGTVNYMRLLMLDDAKYAGEDG